MTSTTTLTPPLTLLLLPSWLEFDISNVVFVSKGNMDIIVRLGEWLRTKFVGEVAEEPPDGLVQSVHDISEPDPRAVAASPFFKLPPELRDMIYMFAFGGQILHMDLQPMYISLYPAGTLEIDQNNERVDSDKPNRRVWHWWSAVCNRNPSDEAFKDQCRRRWARSLLYPDATPGKESIGIMGWLLSCRQAYTETIDILYKNNTIHSSSNLLMLNFPALIPPGHLNRITSLELSGKLFLVDGPPVMKDDQTEGWPAYEVLIDILVSNFPSLRRLYLAIYTGAATAFPGQRRDISDLDFDRLWNGTDRVARRFGRQLQNFEVVLQASVYLALEDVVNNTAIDVVNTDGMELFNGRIWRTVANKDPNADEVGYWVKRGASDYIAICSMGVGMAGISLE